MVADPDLVVECAASGWCGAVVGWERGATGWAVILEDRHGRRRPFELGPAAFLFEGKAVTLVRPVAPPSRSGPLGGGPVRTASGSVSVSQHRARVARGSRIWVEGSQDAALIEKVWGDDLRIEGVVVEQLEGVDHLAELLVDFAPSPGRRVGVLVDHWVPGSKEVRLVEQAIARVDARHVLAIGHPFIDIWQAVRPAVVGIEAWPDVPRDVEWKTGICRALGWPHETVADRAAAWRRIRGSVRGYADLEPALLGRVEELIDFVTAE